MKPQSKVLVALWAMSGAVLMYASRRLALADGTYGGYGLVAGYGLFAFIVPAFLLLLWQKAGW